MANVVMRLGTEDVDKALRPLQSLRVKTTAADWLLAMAYQVNGGSSIGQSNKTQEEEISKEHIGFTTNAKAKDHFQKLQGVCVYAVRFGSPTIFIWLSTFQHHRERTTYLIFSKRPSCGIGPLTLEASVPE